MKRFAICVLCVFMLFVLLTNSNVSYAETEFQNDADAIEEAANSVFMLEIYASNNQKIGVGSGFVAFDSTLLITNYHVIEDGAYVVAIGDDKDQYIVTQVCAFDKQRDIAILRFDTETNIQPLELDDQSTLKRAQPVVAIGSPAGLMNTISIGNISAFYDQNGKDWIQFTAPISSGSSGGALFGRNGKVIGITTATYASTQNINMAVKAKYINELYDKWDKKTYVSINRVTGAGKANAYIAVPATSKTENNSVTVYITSSGTKYHSNPNCSKMKSPIAIDLLEAIERGYGPCGKCYK